MAEPEPVMTHHTPSPDLPASLILVGAGKMGGALLEGWIRLGMPGERLTVIDPNASPVLVATCEQHGIALNPSLSTLRPAEVAVLGIKPQMLDSAAATVSQIVDANTLLISILAGKTIGDLRARLPMVKAIIRCMPNLPASVQRGVTGAAPSPEVTPAQRKTTDALLAGVGTVEWLSSEDLIDAVTAVSGSGPAYVFHLVECLAAAAEQLGLPADMAERLARGTVEGAGELLHRSPLPASTLRENVTSPAGTTAAALEVLMRREGMAPLIAEAVAAAHRRAGELAG
jgi:pyrroline-5-carboxylate reductase